MLEQARPLASALRQLSDSLVALLPSLLLAILLLAVGWIVARVLRALTLRSARTLQRAARAVGLGGIVPAAGVKETTTRVLANVIYWLVILFFLTAATKVLGLSVFAGWLDQLVSYMPKILSGVLIIFAGAVLAGIARDAVTATLPALGDQQRLIAGRLTQGFAFIILFIVGLDQIGIDITVIITVLGVVVATLLGGFRLRSVWARGRSSAT